MAQHTATKADESLRATGLSPLPNGWTWARLEDVAPVNPPTNFDDLDPNCEIPFVPMAAVGEESGAIDFKMRRPCIK